MIALRAQPQITVSPAFIDFQCALLSFRHSASSSSPLLSSSLNWLYFLLACFSISSALMDRFSVWLHSDFEVEYSSSCHVCSLFFLFLSTTACNFIILPGHLTYLFFISGLLIALKALFRSYGHSLWCFFQEHRIFEIVLMQEFHLQLWCLFHHEL